MTTTEPHWLRSTRCSGGKCVEVAKVGDDYLIRDSNSPDMEPLRFTAEEWAAFVAGVNAGEFRF